MITDQLLSIYGKLYCIDFFYKSLYKMIKDYLFEFTLGIKDQIDWNKKVKVIVIYTKIYMEFM